MNSPRKLLAMLITSLPLSPWVHATELDPVVVSASQESPSLAGEHALTATELAQRRAASSDSARLLQNVPGVSLYGAGGVSSLPSLHAAGTKQPPENGCVRAF